MLVSTFTFTTINYILENVSMFKIQDIFFLNIWGQFLYYTVNNKHHYSEGWIFQQVNLWSHLGLHRKKNCQMLKNIFLFFLIREKERWIVYRTQQFYTQCSAIYFFNHMYLFKTKTGDYYKEINFFFSKHFASSFINWNCIQKKKKLV